MAVATVLKPVRKEDLGVILPHEHLFINLTNQFKEPADPVKQKLGNAKISLSNYGFLRRNPYAIRENLVMDDLETTVEEVKVFKQFGGNTIIDCTSIGIHRDPELLRQTALRTGVNIVAGCGYYTQDTHPPDMPNRSPEAIADEMARELTVGIDKSGIRAGVIGEIGTSFPMHPDEIKNLKASALAHKQTGAPIQIHTYPWGKTGLEIADLLIKMGVNPARIVICHIDVAFDLDYLRELLTRGVFIEFDNFGKEFYIDREDRGGFSGGVFAYDLERVKVIKQLIEKGCEKQLLVTNDICLKQMLRRFGGWGYAHILHHIVPMMEDEGIPRSTIDLFIRQNPAAWLCG